MKIGFIGLGAMGKPMACNLIAAGYEVHAFDVVEAAVKEIEGKGAIGSATAGELASKVDVIICSLPNAKIVEGVMCSKGGVFENCKEGTIIIDMSSVAPNSTKAMAQKAAQKGISYIDKTGKNIYHVGEVGGGDAIKMVNNLLLGCNMAALAEALNRALQTPPPAGEDQADYIRQNYSWEKNARDTLALYQRAAARRR